MRDIITGRMSKEFLLNKKKISSYDLDDFMEADFEEEKEMMDDEEYHEIDSIEAYQMEEE